ncbi:MAG TPA: zeta toxin family protein [Hyphomicrobium sp.]|nr:zeta toxin family protein [Hyphomicrobium sp.]
MLYGRVDNRLREGETAAPRPVDPSSLGDVFSAALRETYLGRLHTSRQMASEEAYDNRIDAVREATGIALENPWRTSGFPMIVPTPRNSWGIPGFSIVSSGSLAGNTWSAFDTRLRELAEQFPQHRDIIAPDRPVSDDALALVRGAEQDFNETYARGERGSFLASLAGGAVASFNDPVNVAAIGAGPWNAVGLGARAILWNAAKAGAINAGVELGSYPEVKRWREAAGLTYGADELAFNMGAAALFGGAIDAGGRTAWRGFRQAQGRTPELDAQGGVVRWNRPDPEAALDEAARVLPEDSVARRAADGDTAAVDELIAATGQADDPVLRGARMARDMEAGLEGPPPITADDGEGFRRLSQSLRAATDPDEPPPAVLASFAGEHAIERLAKRGYTLGRDALEIARAMEASGASPDDIWRTTSQLFRERIGEDGPMFYGVFKGADGKWRIEFDESELIAVPGRGVGVGEGSDIAELYPAARGISYTFNEAAGRLEGSHQSILGASRITLDARSADELRSAVAHELQHFIQKQEGLARGGSPDEFRSRNLPNADQIKAEIARLDEIATRHMFRASDGTLFSRPYHWVASKYFDRRIAGMERVAAAIEELATSDRKNSFELYRRLAGEVEARNVQTRLDLSMEDRFEIPPWETESVERGQQIVRSRPGKSEATASVEAALEYLGATQSITPAGPRPSLPREGRTAMGAEALQHGDRGAVQASLLGGDERMAAAMAREMDAAHTRPLIDDPAGPEAKLQADALEQDLAPAIEEATKPDARQKKAEALAEIQAARLASFDERRQTIHLPGFGTEAFEAARRFDFDGEAVVGYDAAVARLADQAEAYAGPRGVAMERQATILIGPPGAGKSRIGKALAREIRSAIVTSDEPKFVIPEFREHGADGAAIVHEEASILARLVEDDLTSRGANVMVEKLGSSKGSIDKLAKRLAGQGYEVRMAVVTAPREVLLPRIQARGERTGRFVPIEEVDKNLVGLAETVEMARQSALFRGVAEIDNGGDAPHILSGRETFGNDLQKALQRASRSVGGTREHGDRSPALGETGLVRGRRGPGGRESPSPAREDEGRSGQEAGSGEVASKKPDPLADLAIAEGRYTHAPAYEALAPEIRAQIDRTARMLPRDVKLRVVDTLRFGEREANGAWDGYDRIVYVSLAAADPVRTARHEVVHALRQSGLMSDAEFDTLYRFAEQAGLREAYGIDANYRDLYHKAYGDRGDAGVEALLREEVIADMFADYSLNGRRFANEFGRPGRTIDKLLDAIVKFLKAVRDALHIRGFDDVRQVLHAIESGEMAGRADLPPLPEGGAVPAGRLFSLGGGSIRDQLRAAVAAGHITLEEAEQIQGRFDQLFRELRSASAAKDALARELDVEAAEKKRRALLTEQARVERVGELLSHRNARGQQDIAAAFFFMHEHHGQGKMEDVEHRRLAILGGWHAKLDELLNEFRRGAISGDLRRRGGETKARLDNVVRELFGVGTGDTKAKTIGEAWTQVAEEARQRFNAAGGAIGKLEGWGLPQWHNPEALLNYGREAWIEHMTPLLDRERMRSALTGQRLSDDELREALGVSWDRITSDGWIDRDPSMQPFGRGALFKQHADHRFLHFKDADTWLNYARDFGQGDPYAAMMGHLSTMARDIAGMEMFGPNPEAMRNYLKQVIEKNAATKKSVARVIEEKTERVAALRDHLSAQTAKTVDSLFALSREMTALSRKNFGKGTRKTKKQLKNLQHQYSYLVHRLEVDDAGVVLRDGRLAEEYRAAVADLATLRQVPFAETTDPLSHARARMARADQMWDAIRGTANAPVDGRFANVLNTGRQLVTAAVLGGAAISALSDVAFNKITRGFVGLPKSTLGVLSGYVRQFGRENRREAVRAGLILDSALHVMHQQSRYAGSLDTGTWSGFLADRVISLQGLAAITQAGKHSFGMAMQAEIADRVGLALADLPGPLRRTLERHGITADEWDQIRASRLYEPEEGATFLRPKEIAEAAGHRLAEKYVGMILRETRYAVPEASVRSSTILKAGSRPGTFVGELARSASQFKSFGIAVVLMHGGRIGQEIGAGRGANGAFYAGKMLLLGGIFGALALQLKELANGRDPREMTTLEFWGAALLQGGGLGIYGDFLFSNVNRFGGGLEGTLAGPLAGRVGTLRDATIGSAMDVAAGKDPKLGRTGVQLAREWTPGGSLWYMRLAYERVVLDQLQHMMDPEAKKAFQTRMRNRQRDYGQAFWWRPGESAPARAPQYGGR